MINILRTFCIILILSHYSNATVDLMSNINGSKALLAQSVDNDLYIDILKNLLAVDDKWIAEEYKPYVDTVKFGSFFGENTKDKMILIKYNKLPHVAGTDRTELLVVNEDSSLRIMKTYSADDVSVTILPSDSGPCFILAICTSTSTGAMSQSVSISHIEDNTFVEDDIDYLYDYNESDHMDTVNNIPIIKNIAFVFEDINGINFAVMEKYPITESNRVSSYIWNQYDERFEEISSDRIAETECVTEDLGEKNETEVSGKKQAYWVIIIIQMIVILAALGGLVYIIRKQQIVSKSKKEK